MDENLYSDKHKMGGALLASGAAYPQESSANELK